MGFIVDDATEDDVAGIVEILEEATGDLAALFSPPLGEALRSPPDPEWETADLTSALADPERVVLVARDGPDLVAAGLCRIERGGDDLLPDSRLVIDQVAVRREFRRRGVGAALLAALERRARDRGIAALDLAVFEGNEAAIRLFAKAGFRDLEHRMGKVL